MRFRKLRIAWSIAWGLVTLMFILWWVRSHSRIDFVYGITSNRYQQSIHSMAGNVEVLYLLRKGETRGQSLPMSHASSPWDPSRMDHYLTPFAGNLERDCLAVSLPFWFLATTTALVGAGAWIPRQFSLRTLFIAMTFVAILPGLMVWSRRNANPFVPPPDQLYSRLAKFVEERDFRAAWLVLDNVNTEAQARYAVKQKDFRWMAVQEDTLVVPGVDERAAIALTPSDVWIMPGTSKSDENFDWQWTATEFAKQYNESLKTEIVQSK